jgi:hypothetical protein
MKNFKLKFFPVLCASVLFSCGQKPETNPIVATVGSKKITVQEFSDRAAFSPERLAVRPAPDKGQLLQLLISEKLLALEAEIQDMNSQRIKELADFTEKLAVTRELFITEVRQNVRLDSADVHLALERSRQERKISFLQFIDLETANDYLRKWQNSSFKRTVKELNGDDADPARNQRVFKWGDNDALLEEAIYKLEVGELSPVIPVPNGFLLVRCDDIIYTAVDKTTQQNRTRKVKQILTARQEAQLSKQFVSGFMKSQNVRFDKNQVRKIIDAISRVVNEQQNGDETELKEIPVPEHAVLGALESTKEFHGDPIVEFDGGQLGVDEFLNMWRAYHFSVQQHPAACRKALNDQFSLVIRDHLLAGEARRRGLDVAPNVLRDVQMWRDYYLSESITQQLSQDELDELLQKLRQQHTVEIDNDRLQEIELSDIPVIAMRPGQYTSRVTPSWPSFINLSSTTQQ